MSIPITFNGVIYDIPEFRDTDYANDLTNFFVAHQNGTLQPTGGMFTLLAEVNFGNNFGLRAKELTLGGALDSSSILSITSTTKGFLPPRMTTTQRDAISSPTAGLFIYNTDSALLNYYNGVAWTTLDTGSGTGTVGVGLINQLAYYPANGTTVTGLASITASKALVSNASGLPVASTTTTTELQGLHLLAASKAIVTDGSGILTTSTTTAAEIGFVAGVTSAIQSQLDLKAPLASPTFTGIVTIPSPFTLGATPMTATATELNYVVGVTSPIQTQIDGKATDALVVHLAGTEIITGLKTFTAATLLLESAQSGATSLLENRNTSNTASSNAKIAAEVGGTSAGDAFFTSGVTSGNFWAWGLDNSDSDAWCLTNASTLNGTNLIRASTTDGVAIQGTTTNAVATTGYVGEQMESTAQANFPTSGTTGDLTSLTLTAGDWDMTAGLYIVVNGTTDSFYQFGISATSGNNFTTGISQGYNAFRIPGEASPKGGNGAVPRYLVNLNSTTTYYLKYNATYTGTTPQAIGSLTARRIR